MVPRNLIRPICPACGDHTLIPVKAPNEESYRMPIPYHSRPCRVVVDLYPTGDYDATELPDHISYEEALIRGSTFEPAA